MGDRRFAPLLVALAVGACAADLHRGRLLSSEGATSFESLLARHRPEPGRNTTPILLERGERTSRHLVYIRDRESPHLHATHDIAVLLVGGRGRIHVGSTSHPMRPGDLVVIEAGTPHYFVNEGNDPAAAFVVFSPPLDEPDSVPVGP